MLACHLTRVQATIKADKWGILTFHEENGQRDSCPLLERYDNLKVASRFWVAVCATNLNEDTEALVIRRPGPCRYQVL